jgi:hypothetical protein
VEVIGLLWDYVSDKLATKHPILLGVPLMLLPVFIIAGIIYLLAS